MKKKTIDEIGFELLGSNYYQLKHLIIDTFWPHVEKIINTYAKQETKSNQEAFAKFIAKNGWKWSYTHGHWYDLFKKNKPMTTKELVEHFNKDNV